MKNNYFTLNKALYHKANIINVSAVYSKTKGGYIARAEAPEDIGNGLISKAFCKEYYQHDGDGEELIIQAGRKSSKKEAEAEKYVSAHSREYAEAYLRHVKEELNLTAASQKDAHIQIIRF